MGSFISCRPEVATEANDIIMSFEIQSTSNFWRETHWFAIHAKAHCEAFAVENVTGVGARIFFPQIFEERVIRRCWRKVVKPLFAGYFFAQFCPEKVIESVRNARGVLAVVGCGVSPIPISDGLITELQECVATDGYIHFNKPSLVKGDRVRIEDGPFAGWIGRIEMECDDRKRVGLLLEAVRFGRILIEKRCLTAVQTVAVA